MTNIVSGLTALVFGGYILMMFGNVVLQSLRDKRVRDDLLSDPHVRNPTRFHKMAFTALAALLLVFALLLIDERASPSDMDMRSIAQASAHLVTATPMESLSKPEPLQQLYQVWVSQGTPPA